MRKGSNSGISLSSTMRRVTLLLSGVPKFVTLRDLSYNLDRLFNTDEIETFKIRNLPNHPQTNKRQIALDFRSGYDAMAAQEKLEGYTYELDNGREYTLHAKINTSEEYKCSESPELGGSQWYGDNWTALAMIPNVSGGDMYYQAHARLDAQLELLRKQKLVLEKEKEVLNERQKLKRKYGSMVSSLYEVPSTPLMEPNHYVDQTGNSETEISPPKRSRSTSRDRWSSSKHPRSRSRENRPRGSHRSGSKDSGYVHPQIEWYEIGQRREQRSQSGERSRSHAYSRDRRSSSREPRDRRYPVSRHRELRSRLDDRRRSTSRECGVRSRSRSTGAGTRLKERRSRSREWMNYRRSISKDRMPRRSRSRDRTLLNDARAARSDWDRTGRRLRSPDTRANQLAIMPRSLLGKSPSEWSVGSLKSAGTSTDNTKHNADITNKEVFIKVEKDANNTAIKDTKENKTDTIKIKNKERTRVDKFNSKLRKAEKAASRVQALSKDVMILVAIVVDEIMDREKIRISVSNKVALIKTLEALVQVRLQPIVRVKRNDDIEVLKKYKIEYPMEDDFNMIKQMLGEIPKLEMKEPKATVTVNSESEKNNVTDIEILDVDSSPTKQQCNTKTPLDLSVENTDNAPRIKQELTEEPIIIIDIDSADKPVPRHPQFVVVIKILVKHMRKVILVNKLGEEIKIAELKYVLRHILRNMLKGRGFLPREEIIRTFRESYPMEKDEQFVRNTIKDIRDGKYPLLTGHVADTPESDRPDDVVLIEKKYDVVTLTDSDDDDVEKKPKLEVINLDCEPTYKLGSVNPSQAKPNPSPSQALPGPSNGPINSGPVNPDEIKSGSANFGYGKLCSTNACQTNKGPDNCGQTMTGLPNISQAKTGSDNLAPANTDAGITSQARINPAKTSEIVESANPGQAKIGPARGRDMTELASPIQAKTGLVNPSLALPGPANASQDEAGPGNSSQAKKSPNNPSQAFPESDRPDDVVVIEKKYDVVTLTDSDDDDVEKKPKLEVINLDCEPTYKLGSVNPSQAKPNPSPSQALPGPSNGPINSGPVNPDEIKSGSANFGYGKLCSTNACQTNKGPDNCGQTMTGLPNISQAKTGSDNLAPANTDAGITSQARINPAKTSEIVESANPGQAKIGPARGRDMTELASPIQAKTGLVNPSLALPGPANASQDEAGPGHSSQAKKSPNNPSQDFPGKVEETPECDKTSNEDSKDQGRNTIEDNDYNLKVTAITIVTSLNELIAKTANAPESVPVEEVKKEIEIEEEEELDNSSLNTDNAPRVTSITIMTSDAELFSLGNEERKEVSEIKNEDVYYDAEDNLVNDIEQAFNNVNFGKSIMQGEQNSVNSQVTKQQLTREEHTSEQFSSKTQLTQDNRTVEDDEETIESIVKYVASMY